VPNPGAVLREKQAQSSGGSAWVRLLNFCDRAMA
jgi:hypothetical protein